MDLTLDTASYLQLDITSNWWVTEGVKVLEQTIYLCRVGHSIYFNLKKIVRRLFLLLHFGQGFAVPHL